MAQSHGISANLFFYTILYDEIYKTENFKDTISFNFQNTEKYNNYTIISFLYLIGIFLEYEIEVANHYL